MVKTENSTTIQSDPLRSTAAAAASASRNKKKYKGVRMRSWGSWVSEIRAPNQKTRIWLGSYSTAEAAARAYDAALICLKGSSANLNFPLSHSRFIPDTIMSPKSIQRVAAAAAAAANTKYDSFDSFESDDNATNGNGNGNPSTTIVNGGGCAAGTATISSTSFSPPLSSTSSSTSSPASPSPSSSSSNQSEDIDASSTTNSSLPYYYPSYTTSTTYEGHYAEELMRPSSMDPWIDLGDLQSPKYMDHVLNANAMFNMPSIEDFYEGGDLSLWSFC